MNHPAALTGWQVSVPSTLYSSYYTFTCAVSSVHYSVILVQIFSYNLHKTREDLTHLTSLKTLGSRV